MNDERKASSLDKYLQSIRTVADVHGPHNLIHGTYCTADMLQPDSIFP